MQPFTLRACVAVLIAGTAGTVCAQNKLYDHYGQAAGNLAGASVNAAGDVDQDGFSDYVEGIPGTGIESPGRARVYSGVSGKLIFEIAGDGQTLFRLGQRVAPAGDTDADGHDDLIVVSDDVLGVYSGFDGELRWQIVSFEPQLGFAEAAGVGDVNGDRYADVLVGVSQLEVNIDLDLVKLDSEGPGYATLYSGFDGSVLMSFEGDQHGDGFGGTVAMGGDLDGDGTRDFVIGCYNADFPAAGAGYLRAFSGEDGSVMWQLPSAEEGLGYVADVMGDVDGDGGPDLVLGAPQLGMVLFVRGVDGTILRNSRQFDPNDDYGTAVSGIGDVDGDGVVDALVGAPQPSFQTMFGTEIVTGPGYVQVLSGQTADAIATFDGLMDGDEFGRSLSGLGDANGDGRPDLIAGAAQNAQGGVQAGMSRVLSADALTLFTDVHELSMEEGGVQLLELQVDQAYAGHLAMRLGSMTGIAPGGAVGEVMVPLVFDAYSQLFLTPISTAPIGSDDFLVLDETGHANKKIGLFPGHLAMAHDVTLWHAYVIFDPLTLQPELATNAAAVNLYAADDVAGEAAIGGASSAPWMPKGGWPVIDDAEPPSGRIEPANPGASLSLAGPATAGTSSIGPIILVPEGPAGPAGAAVPDAAQAKKRKGTNLAPKNELTVIHVDPTAAVGVTSSLDPLSEAVQERDSGGAIILVPGNGQPLQPEIEPDAAQSKNREGTNLAPQSELTVIQVDPSAAVGVTSSLDPLSGAVQERDSGGTIILVPGNSKPLQPELQPDAAQSKKLKGTNLAPKKELTVIHVDPTAAVGVTSSLDPLSGAVQERDSGGAIILVPGNGQPLQPELQPDAAQSKNREGTNLAPKKELTVIQVDPSAAVGVTSSLDPLSGAVQERDEPGLDTVDVLSISFLPAMAGLPSSEAGGSASTGGPLAEAAQERIGGTIILVPGNSQPLQPEIQPDAAQSKNREGTNLAPKSGLTVIQVDPSAAVGVTSSLDPLSGAVQERDEPGLDTVDVLSISFLPAMAGLPLGATSGSASAGGPLAEAPQERIGGTIILVPGLGFLPTPLLSAQASLQTRSAGQPGNGK